MTPSTPLPDRLQWSEGMLLSPQHLQQDHLYWEAQMQHRFACMAPHAWGLRRLALNQSGLAAGVLSVASLECVLPDGSLVQYPGAGPATTLELDLNNHAAAHAPALRVYLVVRGNARGAALADNAERRYSPDYSDLAEDENTGADPVPVYRLRLRYELQAYPASAPPPANLVACPLLELSYSTSRHLKLGDYHPPMLGMEASAFLGDDSLQRRLDQLLAALWRKAAELAGNQDNHEWPDEPGAAGGAQLRAARILAANLPLLDLSIRDPGLHPGVLYRLLAQAVGHAAGLGGHALPPRLAPYDHADCRPQFVRACAYIEDRLKNLQLDYERLQFAHLPREYRFSRRLPADARGELIVEVRAQPGRSQEAALAWLAAAAIASEDLIHTVRTQRLRTVRIERLNAQQLQQRGLAPTAQLYLVTGEPIDSDGSSAFQSNSRLAIQGAGADNMPASIYLYHYTGTAQLSGQASARPELQDA